MTDKDNSAVGGSSGSEAPRVIEMLQSLMAKMDIQAQAQTQEMKDLAQAQVQKMDTQHRRCVRWYKEASSP